MTVRRTHGSAEQGEMTAAHEWFGGVSSTLNLPLLESPVT